MKKILVIGAGPAGVMAACTAAQRGLNVTLLEKNSKLGRKLAITGKGRCNITNACEVEDLINNVPGNANFLYSAFYSFTNDDTIKLFNELGVQTKIERGNRVFPVSDKAFDVVDALKKHLKNTGVKVLYDVNVEKIEIENNEFKYIQLQDGRKLYGESLVIATGGASYPGTGSTGDGYKFAKSVGHTISDIRPSLVPLEVHEKETVKAMQGLSLKNVEIKIVESKKNKTIVSEFGEMIFTHFGVSGPIVLSSSAHLRKYKIDGLKFCIDLKPALSEEQLDKRIQADFKKYINKHFANSLDDLLPSKMIPIIVEKSGIDPNKQVNSIEHDERLRLVKLIKCFELTLSKARPIEEAIITSGGVSIKEINPSTMESKIVKGLYFAGEVIDVDAYTGGFNLQIAYSTGFLAGQNC